jgi:hypothetical protein
MAKGRKKAKAIIPEIPFEIFKDKMVNMWHEAWENKRPHDYQNYVDIMSESFKDDDGTTTTHVHSAYHMYLYLLDVHNGVRKKKEANIYPEVDVEFQETLIPIRVDEIGLRVLKTFAGTFENLVSSQIDVDVNTLMCLTDVDGNPRIDFFRKELEPLELSTLFLSYGVYIYMEQAWDYVSALSVTDIMNQKLISNLEQRALCLSLPEIANELRGYLEKVDTFVDTKDEENPSVYTLYKSEENFLGIEGHISYISCICPSTGRSFMLSCDNGFTNAKDAIASLLMVPEELIPHIDFISRQGEIFLVTFTLDVESDEFKKKMTSNRVGLDGELYFSKLIYES